MKANFTNLILVAGLFCVSTFTNSCAKPDHSADKPKEQLVLGDWWIGRIQLRLYNNGVFVKDTIIENKGKPRNFVNFDANGAFRYSFNSPTIDVGSYEFTGSTALVTNSNPKSYKWTTITLTDVLFTVVSKDPDPAFPGYTVERYQTFIR